MRYPIFTTATTLPGRVAVNPLDVAYVLPFKEQAYIHMNSPTEAGHMVWQVTESFEAVIAALEEATQGPAQAAPASPAR